MIKYPVIILSITSLGLLFYFTKGIGKDDPPKYYPDENIVMDYSSLRDTLYTLKPYFIEVNLTSQTGYLHSRYDSLMEFGLSTGTRRIEDGVETKEGLFVIQSMMPRWHSRQFDSTLMLNWMGFNYGIGFHALLGNSYYRYLGVRKSSHGCVRLSREDAKDIYSKIDFGTPVLVHSGYPAITIAFADSSDELSIPDYSQMRILLPERFLSLYGGKYLTENLPRLLIDRSNVGHPGLPIGDARRIPKRQVILPIHRYIQPVIPSVLNLELVKREPAK